MEEKQCFLCRESEEILYKICDCNDSTICSECYGYKETHIMKTCAICRKKYEFNYKRQYLIVFKILGKYLIKYGIIIGLELFPPLYLYINEDYTDTHNIFLGISLFCILFCNIINYYLLNIIVMDDITFVNYVNIYILIKFMLICIIFLILLQYHNNKILGYSIFILGFIYILPVIVFCLILVITKLTNFLEDINKKSLYKTIKIKSIYTNLQGTINNV
jgi:hypothetical protein